MSVNRVTSLEELVGLRSERGISCLRVWEALRMPLEDVVRQSESGAGQRCTITAPSATCAGYTRTGATVSVVQAPESKRKAY